MSFIRSSSSPNTHREFYKVQLFAKTHHELYKVQLFSKTHREFIRSSSSPNTHHEFYKVQLFSKTHRAGCKAFASWRFAGLPAFCHKNAISPQVQQMPFFRVPVYQALPNACPAGPPRRLHPPGKMNRPRGKCTVFAEIPGTFPALHSPPLRT